MNKKYKFISNQITNMIFNRNIPNKKDYKEKLVISTKSKIDQLFTDSNRYLIQFNINILDLYNNANLSVIIENVIELNIEQNENIKMILKEICLPDLFNNYVKTMIKTITTNMNITPINLPLFQDIKEYTEKDEKRLIYPITKEKVENKEKELEIMEYWTMSIDWKKKCVNINFNDLHKKIELSIKDVKSIINSFKLLKMKEEGLF